MCYSVYLSTDANDDLTQYNQDLLRFQKTSPDGPIKSLLKYANKWYVGSKSGCSCTFRHLYSIELGFSEPVDWYKESEDQIAATLSFAEVVRNLMDQAHSVDCIDAWGNVELKEIIEIKVDFRGMKNEQFRFFENHHFIFV